MKLVLADRFDERDAARGSSSTAAGVDLVAAVADEQVAHRRSPSRTRW
jgi:hypothetical protein